MSAFGPSAALAALALTGAAVGGVSGDQVTRLADPEIVESSGLVVVDDTFVTTNDSGDVGRLFVVDSATGETVRQIPWSADPADVEALAPAGNGEVWVGDIGDNDADRSEVAVALVDLDGADPARRYRLRYPDGPADAETLLAHPKTGQLFVVTKSVVAGTVLAVPSRLRVAGVTTLSDQGSVAGLITDGAFFPDGRHLIVRNYTEAFVYAYPTLDLVGSFDLPDQEQGEGLAIAGPDSVYLSSEGVEAPILRVRLPGELRSAMGPADTPTANADVPRETERSPSAPPTTAAARGPSRWVWLVAGFVGGLGGLGALWLSRDRLRR
jgi:hypothetical protein